MMSYIKQNGVKIIRVPDNLCIYCHRPVYGSPTAIAFWESEKLHVLGQAHTICACEATERHEQ